MPASVTGVPTKSTGETLSAAEFNNVNITINAHAENIDDFVTLFGTLIDDTGLGTFTGTTIGDDVNLRTALQQLETALEAGSAAFDASGFNNVLTTDDDTIQEVFDKVDDLVVNDLVTTDADRALSALQGFALNIGLTNVTDLVGSPNATDLGTFTGTTIADSSTVKAALQSLETAVEGAGQEGTKVRVSDETTAGDYTLVVGDFSADGVDPAYLRKTTTGDVVIPGGLGVDTGALLYVKHSHTAGAAKDITATGPASVVGNTTFEEGQVVTILCIASDSYEVMGPGGDPGIDDVLAGGQSLSANRTITLDGNSVTFAGGNDIVLDNTGRVTGIGFDETADVDTVETGVPLAMDLLVHSNYVRTITTSSTGDFNISNPTNANAGAYQEISLRVLNADTGDRDVVFGTAFLDNDNTQLGTITMATLVDYTFRFYKNGTAWKLMGDPRPKFDSVLNVLDYGADPTGTVDSTSAIQAAIDDAYVDGGTVYVPAGTYEISSAVVTGTKVKLVGDGDGSVIRQATSNIPIVSVTKAALNYDWEIRDLRLLYGTQQTTSEAGALGIRISESSKNSYRGVVRNVQVDKAYRGVSLPDEPGCTAFLVEFDNVHLYRCADWGFYWVGDSGSGSRTNLVMNRVWTSQEGGSEIATSKGFNIRHTNGITLDNVGCDHIQAARALYIQSCHGRIGTFWCESSDFTVTSGATEVASIIDSQLKWDVFYNASNTADISSGASLVLLRIQSGSIVDVFKLQDNTPTITGTGTYRLGQASSSDELFVENVEATESANLADFGFEKFIRKWDGNWRTRRDGSRRTVWATAAPGSETWAVGDQVINTAPTAGGFMGWTCVTAGTPGTWKGFGAIEA